MPAELEQLAERIPRVVVVLDDQHVASGPPGGGGGGALRDRRGGRRWDRRQAHGELAALSRPRLAAIARPPCSSASRCTSVSPMPSPPDDAVERTIALHEQVEDARRELGRHADAVVAHA